MHVVGESAPSTVMSTIVDIRREWTYAHIMTLQRIATPADLGAIVRESRLLAHLTQAELAAKAEVSREWLIGLERGSRPRAELTKVLAVLDVLDLPLTVGGASSTSGGGEEPGRTDFAALMPVIDQSALDALARGAMPSAGALLRASFLTTDADEGGGSEDGSGERRADQMERPQVDVDAPAEGRP